MKVMNRINENYRFIIAAGALILGAAGTFVYLQMTQPVATTDATLSRQGRHMTSQKQTHSPVVTLSAMGDFLAHDSVVQQAKTREGYDFSPYFSTITSLYDAKGVVFCNPETPAAGEAYGISGYPAFNAPIELARDMNKAGCNLINLATNHLADKGQAAINATRETWEKLPILAVHGANRSMDEQQKVAYFEKDGIKMAFVAFADFSNSPLPHSYSVTSYRDEALVRRLLKEARNQADVVIVSAHWGTEGSHEVNPDQRSAARLFSELGADVVIGTGPHVLQEVDMLSRADGNKTLVWYSIGNLLSSQLNPDELTGGVAQCKLTKTAKGIVISDVTFRPTFMSYEWSAADRQAQNLLARRNLKLQPLKKAEDETKLHGVSVAERLTKVRQWLGTNIPVAIE